MYTDEIAIINKKIDLLIDDKNTYDFDTLRKKVEKILNNIEIFMIDNKLDSKAVDLYLKKVITKRNKLSKEEEKSKLINDQKTKYTLIETICKKYEFETKEELIKKIEYLEKKTNLELKEIVSKLP